MPELENMSLSELKALRKDVDAAIASFEERKKAEARAALEEKAREMGFSLDEIVKAKGRRAKVPAKYRNPAEPSQTWSGRGRRPKWLEEALNAGKSLEDFLIG
ncbi:DNA-binding protein H-NS [Rhodovulum adriaticum]|uniref:DNA-binding protein H-NS n=2 Tax=Rhodovulum adriaticum TaxID=35804 RepID=A0A4R2NIE7_RHOAD|nr:H-NS histone family protein [Rhodovulum adriaticum]MBK1635802.1 transcriptional regulator [Rhodovulum adriaticum]TCP21032.1 DNA-binding protein H-NS [Rhodovulum adriaticum]